MKTKTKSFKSDISGKDFSGNELVYGSSVRKSLYDLVLKDVPSFNVNSKIALSELNVYREQYIAQFMMKDKHELDDLETKVLDTITKSENISSNPDANEKLSFGDHVSDKVASFGGSWTFIISFLSCMAVWIGINVLLYANKGFDPYPFILLNLLLSCIAALQAPVIMMSQNRQEQKDRKRAESDYLINLKSELEIRTLHEKIDHLMIHQQQELIEIQKVQIDLLNDIVAKLNIP